MLPVGVAIGRDRECREMVANAEFLRIVGMAPSVNPAKSRIQADRLPYRVVENGVDVKPEDLPMLVAAREGIAVSSLCHIVREDGKTVMLQGRTVPLLDEQGEPCGSVGAFVDVTERENLIRELKAAQETIRTLTGLLPICAHCKSIRNADDRWERLESYIAARSQAQFTHTICPACLEKHFGKAG